MARLPIITGEFRTVKDPELRFTPSGKAVASVTVIASESKKNEQSGEWEDGDKTPFINVSVWDKAAEALAEEISKGQRVLVTGALFQREYQKSDGTQGTSIDLKWATVAAIPGGKSRAQREGVAFGQAPAKVQGNDPWATTTDNGDAPF